MNPLGKLLAVLLAIARVQGRFVKISRLEPAVSFILQKTCIDKFIVGLEDKDQLKEILNIKLKKKVYRYPNLNIKDKKILNPYYWIT